MRQNKSKIQSMAFIRKYYFVFSFVYMCVYCIYVLTINMRYSNKLVY